MIILNFIIALTHEKCKFCCAFFVASPNYFVWKSNHVFFRKKRRIFFKKGIDKKHSLCYNILAFQTGGIAQLARATGSYPVGHGFKSNSRYQKPYKMRVFISAFCKIRPVGQAVKTPPFHGGNRSSILLRVTKSKRPPRERWSFAFDGP